MEWFNVKSTLPDISERKIRVVICLSSSKYGDKWCKNIGLYTKLEDDTKPMFYIGGNPDKNVRYWTYFPEDLPEYFAGNIVY